MIQTITTYSLKIGLLILVINGSVSCAHKDLDFGGSDGTAQIRFDWSDVANAQPNGMLLIVFKGSSQPVNLPFVESWGGSVRLPAGNYQMIAHNDNLSNVIAWGDSWQEYRLYAQSTEINSFSRMFAGTRVVPRSAGTEEQSVIFEPDLIWTAAVPEAIIDKRSSITMLMKEVTEEYVFTISETKNLENVVEIVGTLSGMAESYLPVLQKSENYSCIIPFNLASDGQSIRGRVRTFGNRCSEYYLEHGDVEHKLTIYILLKDNSKYFATFDVTDAINEAQQEAYVSGIDSEIPLSIVIDEFVIPEPMLDDSGLNASVDEWKEVNINISM